MVDGVVLLVDASRGPAAADPVRAAQGAEAKLPVILVINKVDRPDARIAEVVDETYELFLDLDADEHQIEFPIVYASRQGRPGLARPARGRQRCPTRADLEPLFDTILETDPGADLHRGRAAAGARHQPRRLALPRPARAVPRRRRARSARASRSPGAGPTARSSGSRSPSC